MPSLCMLLESYYPVVGGMETQARNMADSFRKAGLDIFILTRRTSPDLKRNELVDDTPVFRVGPTGRSSRLRWMLCLTCIPTLIRKRKDYDIILVPGFRALGITAVLIAKLLGKRSVLKAESSGEMSGEFFAGGLEKMKLNKGSALVRFGLKLRNRLLAKADAFASLSREQTNEFKTCGVSDEQIVVIPQSVRTDLFQPPSPEEKLSLREKLGLPKNEVIVIYTGRLVSYKGLPLLLEAWRTIHEKYPGARLIAAGAGGVDVFNCEDEVKQYAKENNLNDCVTFTGAVNNVDEYLKASDIYALPTQNEAFPLALLEGMACGLAVISTPVGGIPDIVKHEKNGLMVKPGSEEELRAALLRLMADKPLREQLGEAGLKTARENYAREIVTRKYLELFEKYVT